jgi:hypothetical protein
MEQFAGERTILGVPFEYQHRLEVFDFMEENLKSTDKLMTLSH